MIRDIYGKEGFEYVVIVSIYNHTPLIMYRKKESEANNTFREYSNRGYYRHKLIQEVNMYRTDGTDNLQKDIVLLKEWFVYAYYAIKWYDKYLTITKDEEGNTIARQTLELNESVVFSLEKYAKEFVDFLKGDLEDLSMEKIKRDRFKGKLYK